MTTREYKNAWGNSGKFDHKVLPLILLFKTLYETCLTP